MPAAYTQIKGIRNKLEAHFKDMQDLEFTIQDDVYGCFRRATASATVPPRCAWPWKCIKEDDQRRRSGLARNTRPAR